MEILKKVQKIMNANECYEENSSGNVMENVMRKKNKNNVVSVDQLS